MKSSLTEFDYIKKDNNIFVRDEDIIKLLLLKSSFTKEDIDKLSDTLQQLAQSKL